MCFRYTGTMYVSITTVLHLLSLASLVCHLVKAYWYYLFSYKEIALTVRVTHTSNFRSYYITRYFKIGCRSFRLLQPIYTPVLSWIWLSFIYCTPDFRLNGKIAIDLRWASWTSTLVTFLHITISLLTRQYYFPTVDSFLMGCL